MSNFLFNDFEKLTPTAWKQKIQVDLKGAEYNETLLWRTAEGITVKPFYTSEDRTNAYIDLPSKGFNICQSVFVGNVNIANKLALDALKRGATAIQFRADSSFDISELIRDIDYSTTLYFELNFLDTDFIKKLEKTCEKFPSYYQLDILGNLARTGNWFKGQNSDINKAKDICKSIPNSIHVDASIYQNAGANITQQLAYALSQTNEYLELLGEEAVSNIHFTFSVGSNYFFEIAKIRAFRILHASLLKERDIKSVNLHIFTKPTLRNKTLYDYNVNMLRTTSESMSAILGGSNTVSNIAYDSIYHKSNEFGERISRNQLLILQKESYLSEAQSFANGSYYIERITHQLAEKALDIFKKLENGGGFLKQLIEGTVQKKIKESAINEIEKFNNLDIILLGTNKLLNEKDKMANDLELYPFLKKKNLKTYISPILPTRISEKNEQTRLETERA